MKGKTIYQKAGPKLLDEVRINIKGNFLSLTFILPLFFVLEILSHHHHGVLINVQVQELLPHQWAPLQVTG